MYHLGHFIGSRVIASYLEAYFIEVLLDEFIIIIACTLPVARELECIYC